MNDNSDRRGDQRNPRNEKIAIQILLPGPDGPGTGRVLRSKTLDVSREGLRILIEEPVAADHYFDFCIEFKDYEKIFLLTGEIRWCRPAPEECFEAGILIHDGEKTDFDAWIAFMGKQEAEATG
jgi:hypothetical protein